MIHDLDGNGWPTILDAHALLAHVLNYIMLLQLLLYNIYAVVIHSTGKGKTEIRNHSVIVSFKLEEIASRMFFR